MTREYYHFFIQIATFVKLCKKPVKNLVNCKSNFYLRAFSHAILAFYGYIKKVVFTFSIEHVKNLVKPL